MSVSSVETEILGKVHWTWTHRSELISNEWGGESCKSIEKYTVHGGKYCPQKDSVGRE